MNFAPFLAQWQSAKQEAMANAASRLKQLLKARPAISRIVVNYDGYGDQGCFDIDLLDSKGQRTDDPDLQEAVVAMMCSTLPDGWEIDDGSLGEAEICVNTDRIRIIHTERVTKLVTTEWEFGYGTSASPFDE